MRLHGQVPGAETGRWVLRLPDGTELHHVRAASFTPTEPTAGTEPVPSDEPATEQVAW